MMHPRRFGQCCILVGLLFLTTAPQALATRIAVLSDIHVYKSAKVPASFNRAQVHEQVIGLILTGQDSSSANANQPALEIQVRTWSPTLQRWTTFYDSK